MIGAATLPFTAGLAGSGSDTAALDPTLARLGALLSAALIADLANGWATVRTALGSTHPLYSAAVVNRVAYMPPDPATLQTQDQALPTLYVYRAAEAQTAQPWLAWTDSSATTIEALWCPGALDSGESNKLRHLMTRGIPSSARAACDRGGHASYDSGKTQFLPTEVLSLRLASSQMVSLSRGEADAPVQCVLLTIDIVEPTAAVPETAVALAALDFELWGVGPDGVDDEDVDVDDHLWAEVQVGDDPPEPEPED